MDSWSRPGKSQATPAPYYLLPGGEETPYCRSCGRVISSRRVNAPASGGIKGNTTSVETKYCSARCRNSKPRKLDRDIEAVFVHMLLGGETNQDYNLPRVKEGKSRKLVKGDPRILVACDEVERMVFGDSSDSTKTFGRKKNRSSRALPVHQGDDFQQTSQRQTAARDDEDEGSEDGADSGTDIQIVHDIGKDAPYVDGDVLARLSVRSGTRIRPPQTVSEVNGSVGGEKGRAERMAETDEMAQRRAEGQKKAQQREMVRRAARRGVVFGFDVHAGEGPTTLKKCEAVMQGKVVEPSFAKGNWAVRWRE